MAVQLPPNSTGSIVDTRVVDSRERQLLAIAEPLRSAPTRSQTGFPILYEENFRGIQPGFWNDALGSASRDVDVMFGGYPSMRLDTQMQSAGAVTNPGRVARASGVITKRRILDGFRHRFGMECWFRLTSTNLTSSAFLSMSIYNRTGTNAHHARVWLDPNGNNQPMVARILDGAATNALSGVDSTATAVYTAVSTSVLQNGGGSHTYSPETGRLDRVGGWHFIKLVVDFVTGKYVSLQLDGEDVVDCSAYDIDVVTSTGFAGMHHSFEFCGSNTLRRYVNVAHVIGTMEDV
jgi:hypothetical protein